MGKNKTAETGEKKEKRQTTGGKPKHTSSGKMKEVHLTCHVRSLAKKMQRNNAPQEYTDENPCRRIASTPRPRVAMDLVALSALKKLTGDTPLVKLATDLAAKFPRRIPIFHPPMTTVSTPQEQAV